MVIENHGRVLFVFTFNSKNHMEERTLKVLHIQMQAVTKGAEEYARLLSSVIKTIGQMVNDRRKDLTKITADQQAFLAQKDLAGGKKTMKAYYWMVCGDAYDTEHPRG